MPETVVPSLPSGAFAIASELLEPSVPALLAALDCTPQGVLLFDSSRRLLHVTDGFRTQLRVSPQHLAEGRDLIEVLRHADLTSESLASIQSLLANLEQVRLPSTLNLHLNDNTLVHMRLQHPVADLFVAHVEAAAGPDDGQHAPTNDIDGLTGLGSRRRFDEALAAGFQHGGRFAILLLDLDRFKLINDTLGHPAGDVLLQRVAERLRVVTRAEDVVARLGGDEFAILLRQSPAADIAAAIARRILDVVQRTYLIDGQPIHVGASIGIACAPEHGSDARTLLRSAELAMYQSKNAGRARYHFFETVLLERAIARRANELDLRRALPLRQLEVHYQPQVSMLGSLVGFEALVRWRHPERGLIPPAEFLPVAEEIGLINAIGEWVLRTACRDAATWPADLIVAVNASPTQIESGTFATGVRRSLASAKLAGPRLELEITEGTLLGNTSIVTRTLADLRALGVRIAMDDFGTGYASLSQLASFPFDKIKIDRSLAGCDGDDVKKRAIVRAITALGRGLGVCTLAEGVEDVDQMTRLERDGCAAVQGYLFGRAVPADEVPAIIATLYRLPAAQS